MGKNDYEITIENCRNVSAVSNGPILIKKNALNVFYGRNGTGKSTVALALRHAYLKTDESRKPLDSYGFLESGDQSIMPVATCSTKIRGLHVFDDEWIDDHCFGKNGLQENAYELYVRDGETRRLEKDRQNKLGRIKAAMSHPEVAQLRESLKKLQKGLGKPKVSGGFAASSPLSKAFKNGVPVETLPHQLKPVVKGMTASERAKWLDWHISHPQVSDSDVCPYCGARDLKRMEACSDYDVTRERADVKQWAQIANMYDELKDALSKSNAALLGSILKKKTPPTTSDFDALAELASSAIEAAEAFESIDEALGKSENIDAVKLVDDLYSAACILSGCRLFLKTKEGKKTAEEKAIGYIVTSVDALKKSQNELDLVSKSLVNIIARNIEGHESEINLFLKQCGYSYAISIECNAQTQDARILLKPLSAGICVNDPGAALSYGERNALALMLFMFEAIKDPRALIVLDDPISSFDYDKRYGILYALFSKTAGVFEENLHGKTVLVTTHDFLVVSDLIGMPGTAMPSPHGSFLSCNPAGVLTCKPLGREAITPYTQLLQRKIKKSVDLPLLMRLVYVRQLCEVLRKSPQDRTTKESWTFNLLSGIIHAHSDETVMAKCKLRARDSKWIAACENYVESLTGEKIDYWDTLARFRDCIPSLVEDYGKAGMSSAEKLLIVRLILMRDDSLCGGANIMKRFVDETCHIGGSYLFQLDEEEFDQIPFYVVQWCDEVVAEARAKYCTTPEDVCAEAEEASQSIGR